MSYKLIAKVPPIPENSSSFDVFIAYQIIGNLVKKEGAENWHWGTPNHKKGYIAEGFNNMRGRREGILGKFLDFFTFKNQYKNEWGVYVEV